MHKAVDIDDRHGNEGAGHAFQFLGFEQAANNLDPEYFITVYGGADEESLTASLSSQDVYRHGHFSMGIQAGNRNVDRQPLARLHVNAGNGQNVIR
jgi:hypothetical protein